MPKFVIHVSIEIDTDVIVDNLKKHNIVKHDGNVNGIEALDYLKGYVGGDIGAKIDTTNLFKEVMDDLDKKLGTKGLF